MPRNSIILLSFLLPRANSATLEGTISQSLATKLPLLHSFVRKVLNALDRILRLRLSTDSALMPNLVRVRALRFALLSCVPHARVTGSVCVCLCI